jgi:hypothetical protein
VDCAVQVEREMTATIESSGARIVGDLATLLAARTAVAPARPPAPGDSAPGDAATACIPAAIGDRMTEGIDVVAGLERGRVSDRPSLARFATYQLAGAIGARIASGVLDLVRRRRGSRFRPGAQRECLTPDEAGASAMQALVDARLLTPSFKRVPWTWIEPPDIAVYGTRELVGAVLGRVAGAVRR